MKTYKHSEELINILVSNGFKDITDKIYPDYWDILKEDKEKYSPDSYKRSFKKIQLVIHFYRSYEIWVKGENIGNLLTEKQLKSIVFYTNLLSIDKTFFNKKKVNPANIWDWLENEKQYHKFMKKNQVEKLEKYLVELNKEVVFN